MIKDHDLFNIKEQDIVNITKYFKKKLKIHKKITLMFDVSLFKKCYGYNICKSDKYYDLWACSETDTYIIWFNLKKHNKFKSMEEVFDSVVHELLHIKYSDIEDENEIISKTKDLLIDFNIYSI